jgi:uncharacterized repeat protein (TIGR01451 family)
MKKLVLILSIILLYQESMFSQALTSFTSATIAPFNSPNFVSTVIDYDNDGDDDVLGWNATIINSGRLYRNNGNSTFSDVSAISNVPTRYYGTSADFDKNGFMDLTYRSDDTVWISFNSGQSFTSLNNNCGFFLLSNVFGTTSSNILSFRMGDINHDGIYDFIANIASNNTSSIVAKIGSLNCFCNYGLTSSPPQNLISFANSSLPLTTQSADIDNDGDFDMLIAQGSNQYSNYSYYIYLNDGFGNYSFYNNSGYTLGRINAFGTLGEFNDDGKVDIMNGAADCCISGNPLSVFFSSNSAYVVSTSAIQRVNNPYYVGATVTDINLDKMIDVVWTNMTATGNSALQCFVNNGNNTFTESASSLNINYGPAIGGCCPINNYQISTMLDLNNDNKPDLDIHEIDRVSPYTIVNNYQRLNSSSNNSVKLKLDACLGLKEGWGARIKYKTGGTWSHQQHTAYSGSNYPFLYLGMANATTIDSLVIYWMGGATSILTNIPAGSYQVVSESNSCSSTNVSLSIYNDVNQNCVSDNEFGIEGIEVVLNPGNYVAVSNSSGFAIFNNIPDGNYTALIDTTNLNWSTSCLVSQTLSIQNGVADCIGFGLTNNNPCTDPDVSIYAPFLRPCLPNQMIYVSACNQTTATGVLNASYVDVELDPLITVTASSLPYTAQGNNVFRFQTGNINPGQCASFNITTTISCNAVLGQTLCMDANLYPVQSCALDTVPSDPVINDGTGGTLNGFPQPCTLPWDQSSLSVDGWCANDSIYFTITNTGELGGGDMECYSPMWITVDGVVTYTDSILITGGQTITLVYPGDGATWILNAEQHPLHPGNSHPNAHVEACGDTTNWNPDDVNDFPQDDADPVIDIYCGVVTGSYDPNDKTGYPIGQTNQKYIQPNQQLQYVIRFQNTGTDTAFTVVIRDTLDTDLNIFTVTSGVSSHQYDFRMYGPRVLEWTFNNILLPDSTTNSDGSNGFVTFHVDQVPNLAPGTEITNDADIYFDFNDPITTNTTMHRIYEGFVNVLNIEDLTQEGKSLLIYPNPTSNIITIQGKEDMHQNFKIFDQMGREVYKGKLNGITTDVYLTNLSKGIYTLKIDGNYKPAQIVKE